MTYPELKQLCEKHHVNCATTKENDVYRLVTHSQGSFELNVDKETISSLGNNPGEIGYFTDYYENLETELRRISK